MSEGGSIAASVVVPAHNEATVLGRCLTALRDGPLALDIVVAANGCTDATAEVTRQHGVRVLEVAEASKVGALNAADASCSAYPRVYVDADVVLNQDDLAQLLQALRRTGVVAAAPRATFEVSRCHRVVRWYYDVWSRLPYAADGFSGTGVYALSEDGRRRFGRFPDVVADDAFVRSIFRPEERIGVPDAASVVFPPRDLRNLVRARSRVWAGNAELRRAHPLLADQASNASGSQWSKLQVLVKQPRAWHKALVYVALSIAFRVIGQVNLIRGSGKSAWGRDESSRITHPTVD